MCDLHLTLCLVDEPQCHITVPDCPELRLELRNELCLLQGVWTMLPQCVKDHAALVDLPLLPKAVQECGSPLCHCQRGGVHLSFVRFFAVSFWMLWSERVCQTQPPQRMKISRC
jgi:hypothetical protein